MNILIVLYIFPLLLPCASCGLLAEEGKNFKLGHVSAVNEKMRDMVWSVIYSNGTRNEVSYCYLEHNFCYDFTMEFTPTKRQEKKTYNNTFGISIVRPEHRGMTIVMEYLHRPTGFRETVFNATLEVFAKPQNPVCSAKKMSDNQFDISCQSPKSFPGVNCDIYQKNLRTYQADKIAKDSGWSYNDQTYKDEHGTEYHKTVCSKTVFLPHKGKVAFYAAMSPKLSIYKEDATVPTNEVLVDVPQSAVQAKLDVHICESNKNQLSMICVADGFKAEPKFSWTIDGQAIEGASFAKKKIATANGVQFQEVCSLDHSNLRKGSLVKCSVKSMSGKQSDSCAVPIPLSLPLRPPVFSSGNELLENETTIQLPRGSQRNLICRTSDGNTGHLKIHCRRSPDDVVYVSSGKNLVSVDVIATPGVPLLCICSAPGLDKCHGMQSRLFVATEANGEGVQMNSLVINVLALIALASVAMGFICCWLLCRYKNHLWNILNDSPPEYKMCDGKPRDSKSLLNYNDF